MVIIFSWFAEYKTINIRMPKDPEKDFVKEFKKIKLKKVKENNSGIKSINICTTEASSHEEGGSLKLTTRAKLLKQSKNRRIFFKSIING